MMCGCAAFAHRHTVEAALAWLDGQLGARGRTELLPLRMAAGRVLATPVVSEVNCLDSTAPRWMVTPSSRKAPRERPLIIAFHWS